MYNINRELLACAGVWFIANLSQNSRPIWTTGAKHKHEHAEHIHRRSGLCKAQECSKSGAYLLSTGSLGTEVFTGECAACGWGVCCSQGNCSASFQLPPTLASCLLTKLSVACKHGIRMQSSCRAMLLRVSTLQVLAC